MTNQANYVVSDVHGRNDLLKALVSECVADAARNGTTPRFTFVGDVCDRGRQTRLAMDTVGDVLSEFEDSELVRGNHEEFALAALAGGDAEMERWLSNGGMETLESYLPGDPNGALALLETMHADHLRMMAASVPLVRDGRFLITHAGVDPSKSLDGQSARDLMCIRRPFLDHVGHLGAVVVHGHTVVGDAPVVTENRVSIDTGAYASGRLTACVIEDGELRFLQTDGSARRVVAVEPVRLDRGFGTCVDRIPEYLMAA